MGKQVNKSKFGKRYDEASKKLESEKLYLVDEALSAIKSTASAKFDETIDVAVNLGVDPKHADQMVRGMVSLPSGTGKEVRVAVFAKGAKAEEAKKAGADIVGEEDLFDTIKAGTIDFDRCIATPDMMAKLAGAVGKILGPRGLMPNPKLGTVTNDVAQAIKDAKGGQVEFRVEKNGIIHAGIGKASFKEVDIKANLLALITALNQAKPSGAKGVYLKKISISTTMGPGLSVDVQDVAGSIAKAA